MGFADGFGFKHGVGWYELDPHKQEVPHSISVDDILHCVQC